MNSTTRISRPALFLVTDGQNDPHRLERIVPEAAAGGVDAVIIREKDMPARELLSLVRNLRALTAGSMLLIVSERVDVALAAGADGVHLGERSLPVDAARRIAGDSGLIIGRSIHDPEEGPRSVRDGAHYLLFGNVFETASHPGRPPAGLARLELAARAAAPAPVLAIGGINGENAPGCLATGAAGIAVISAIMHQPDPRAAARLLHDRIKSEQDRS